MKLSHSFLSLLISLSLFSACAKQSDSSQEIASETKATTTYTYHSDSTYVGFVAYKFNEKVGVPGWFKNFEAEGLPQQANSAKELIQNLKFTIPVSSLETGIDDRNQKIREHFFQTINTSSIEGKVIELNGNDNSGTAQVELKMNEMTKVSSLAYELKDGVFQLSGTINVEIWDALSGINALNKACEILHQGTDGISKLWPTVDIEVKSTLVAL